MFVSCLWFVVVVVRFCTVIREGLFVVGGGFCLFGCFFVTLYDFAV